MAAARRVKEEGADNDLMTRIAADPLFAPVHAELQTLTEPCKFCGRAPEQVPRPDWDFFICGGAVG